MRTVITINYERLRKGCAALDALRERLRGSDSAIRECDAALSGMSSEAFDTLSVRSAAMRLFAKAHIEAVQMLRALISGYADAQEAVMPPVVMGGDVRVNPGSVRRAFDAVRMHAEEACRTAPIQESHEGYVKWTLDAMGAWHSETDWDRINAEVRNGQRVDGLREQIGAALARCRERCDALDAIYRDSVAAFAELDETRSAWLGQMMGTLRKRSGLPAYIPFAIAGVSAPVGCRRLRNVFLMRAKLGARVKDEPPRRPPYVVKPAPKDPHVVYWAYREVLFKSFVETKRDMTAYYTQIPPADAEARAHFDEDWGAYTRWVNRGCAVACTSMALSSIGVDKKPWQVCADNTEQSNPVLMYWGKHGEYKTQKDMTLDIALEKCDAEPLRYAYPIIFSPNHEMHYVVVTGKNDDGTYAIMDPASTETTMRLSHNPSQLVQYYKED